MGERVPDDVLPAQPLETISPREATLRQQTGVLANGQPAPAMQMVDTQQPSAYSRASRRVDPSQFPDSEDTPQASAAPGASTAATRNVPILDVSAQRNAVTGPMSWRRTGLVSRGAIEGAASVATVSVDVLNWVKKKLGFGDENIPGLPTSEDVSSQLDRFGMPVPQTAAEQTQVGMGNIAGGGALGGPRPRTLGPADYAATAGPNANFNQLVAGTTIARQLGMAAETKLTPRVIEQLHDNVTSVLDRVETPTRVFLQNPATTEGELARLSRQFTGSDDRLLENPAIQSLRDLTTPGHFGADDLARVSSNLGKQGKQLASSDWQQAQGIWGAKEYVDNIIRQGLAPEDIAEYTQAQERYKLLKPLLKPGMVNRQTGEINLEQLAAHFEKTDPNNFSMGQTQNPVYQILRQVDTKGLELPGTAGYHSQLMMLARATARIAPNMVQRVYQSGVRPGLEMMINRPGFIQALEGELHGTNVQQQPQQNPGPGGGPNQ